MKDIFPKDELERKLQEQAEKLTLSPDSGGWDKVVSALDKEQKQRHHKGLWWLLLVVVLIGSIAGISFWSTTILDTTKPSKPEKTRPEAGSVTPAPVSSPEEDASQSSGITQTIVEPLTVAPVIIEEKAVQVVPPAAKVSTEHTPDNLPNTTIESHSISDIQSSFGEQEQLPAKSEEPVKEVPSDLNMAIADSSSGTPSIPDVEVMDETTDSVTSEISDTTTLAIMKEDSTAIPQPEDIKEPDQQIRPYYLELEFAANQMQSTVTTDPSFDPLDSLQNHLTNTIQPLIGYNLGINFGYRISRRLSFSLGLEYIRQREQLSFNSKTDTTREIILDPITRLPIDTIESFDTYFLPESGSARINTYQYLSVPLAIHYTLLQSKGWQIDLSSGFTARFLSRASVLAIDLDSNRFRFDLGGSRDTLKFDFIPQDEEATVFRQQQFLWSAQVKVLKDVSQHWQVYVAPHFRSALVDQFQSDYPIRQRTRSYAVSMGVRYKW